MPWIQFILLLVISHHGKPMEYLQIKPPDASKVLSLSPCTNTKDFKYGGVQLDCRSRGLSEFPVEEWIPPDTTTILLDDNSISSINELSLIKAPNLRHLSLKSNQLQTLKAGVFNNSGQLIFLDFEYNSLRLDQNGGWFQGLKNLEELRLGFNHNDRYHASYNEILFVGLTNRLQTLTLDTFSSPLPFNRKFENNCENISTLEITGGVTSIKNDSFTGFGIRNVKSLKITLSSNLIRIMPHSLSGFNVLEFYSLESVPQGIIYSLESLAPFVGRNMTTISFSGVSQDSGNLVGFKRDSVITQYAARYLQQICVRNLILSRNEIFFIESVVFTRSSMCSCLSFLDLSGNPLLGEIGMQFKLLTLQNLRAIKVTNRKYSLFDTNHSLPPDSYFGPTENGMRIRSNKSASSSTLLQENSENVQPIHRPTLILYIPKHLTHFNWNGFSQNSIRIDMNVRIVGGSNLKEFRFSDSGMQRLSGAIQGVENTEVVDISVNDGSLITHTFVSSFPNVLFLNMSSMKLGKVFMKPQSVKLFAALHYIELLDLTKNDIFILPENLFVNNRELKRLYLGGNRLQKIPLDLSLVPNLNLLDLTTNSFLRFSNTEMYMITKHANPRQSFQLQLKGNLFSCSCASIGFLRWLQTTNHIVMDNERNFSCTTETGTVVNTRDFDDLISLWRKCNGQMDFMISLILLCLGSLAFLLFTFFIKFKTQITVVIYQLMKKNLQQTTPRDCDIGVFISYCDDDVEIACSTLRKFIENKLKLTTYVRHRDLLPASDVALSIVSTIHSSWRVLLVISESYLNDQWSFLAMKTAAYSVNISNPDKVVMVVLSNEARWKTPSYVLNVVNEDRIIRLNGNKNKLSLYQKEKLKNALFYFN